MLGLKRGTVKLVPHEEAWEREAEETIRRLRSLLGDAAADLQHVGSTAIPGILAKPILDIAVGAEDFSAVLARRQALEEAGFFLRSSSIENQLLFACGSYVDGTGDEQTHFIHVVEKDGPDRQKQGKRLYAGSGSCSRYSPRLRQPGRDMRTKASEPLGRFMTRKAARASPFSSIFSGNLCYKSQIKALYVDTKCVKLYFDKVSIYMMFAKDNTWERG